MQCVTGDQLRMVLTAAPKVYCGHCRMHCFYVRKIGEGIEIANLAPVGGRPKPVERRCPFCGRDIAAGQDFLLTDKGELR